MDIKLIKGRDLSLSEARYLKQIWSDTFGSGTEIEEKNIKFDHDELFFILYGDKNQVLSFGCLKSVPVKFLKKTYSIKGLGGIVSLVNGRGYGRTLVRSMLKYLQDNKLIGIGFCTRENTPFYEKCGLKVGKGLITRFVQPGGGGHPDGDEDVLYFDEEHLFFEKLFASPRAKVSIPYWW